MLLERPFRRGHGREERRYHDRSAVSSAGVLPATQPPLPTRPRHETPPGVDERCRLSSAQG
jgi:hypothetical protein